MHIYKWIKDVAVHAQVDMELGRYVDSHVDVGIYIHADLHVASEAHVGVNAYVEDDVHVDVGVDVYVDVDIDANVHADASADVFQEGLREPGGWRITGASQNAPV